MKRLTLIIFLHVLTAVFILLAVSGCSTEQLDTSDTPFPDTGPVPAVTLTTAVVNETKVVATPTGTNTPLATETAATESVAAPTTPSPAATAAPALPTVDFPDVVACGHLLPLVAGEVSPRVRALSPDTNDLRAVLAILPDEAKPALDRLLQAPGTVGLAAYQVGADEDGVYLNAQTPMPLASVAKIIHLIAYAEAVAVGELNPTETVTVAELDHFYLPTLDLHAHEDALAGLEEDGRLFGQPPALLLDEVTRMMIEYSSNAATDYLHARLGQERLEETAQALEIEGQTAPCPYAGQFLIMANHTRPQISGLQAYQAYTAEPDRYGGEVMQLTAAFAADETFHDEAIAWRRDTRRPTGRTQRLFSEEFNAHATAAAYAALMASLAQNDVGNAESSFIIRRHLEWPMRYFENQEFFTNLGYKGGSLPGILTTVYYAYPIGDARPTVVALFYHDLPGETYRSLRRSLAHDEFARWLLYEKEAIPALRKLLSQEGQ